VFSKEVQQAIGEELERGFSARSAGNEGRARVCARRAAGAALREFSRLTGQGRSDVATGSAYDLLSAVQDLEQIPLAVKEAARYLITKVDENHRLPGDIDLLQQARVLADELEKLV
jgi:hypothetical protein